MKERNNPEYRKLIGSVRWRRLRERVLAARPLCELCERQGLIVPAEEVHHIVPVESGRTAERMEWLAYDPGNLMALCHVCHREEHRRLGKGTIAEKNKRRGEDLRAWAKEWLGVELPPGGIFSEGEGPR